MGLPRRGLKKLERSLTRPMMSRTMKITNPGRLVSKRVRNAPDMAFYLDPFVCCEHRHLQHLPKIDGLCDKCDAYSASPRKVYTRCGTWYTFVRQSGRNLLSNKDVHPNNLLQHTICQHLLGKDPAYFDRVMRVLEEQTRRLKPPSVSKPKKTVTFGSVDVHTYDSNERVAS